jgi:Arc/MetJ-type ribon-helix-helix transcriptional regulator
MQIQLSEKVAEIVNAQVAFGGYASAAEFISDIVLRADEFNRLKLERLRREVNIGLEEIKRGARPRRKRMPGMNTGVSDWERNLSKQKSGLTPHERPD